MLFNRGTLITHPNDHNYTYIKTPVYYKYGDGGHYHTQCSSIGRASDCRVSVDF